MKILFITHSFNSLSQRLYCELTGRGHQVSIEFDISDSVTEEAVALFQPELIIAPFLKRAIPESIWSRHRCLIVAPWRARRSRAVGAGLGDSARGGRMGGDGLAGRGGDGCRAGLGLGEFPDGGNAQGLVCIAIR